MEGRGGVNPQSLSKIQKIRGEIDSDSGKIWFCKVVKILFGYWFIFNLRIRAE